MLKKIAVMGTQGVGKTTIVNRTSSFFNELNPKSKGMIVREGVRECPLPINQNACLVSQEWIFAKQLLDEAEAEARMIPRRNGFNFIVYDRTVLDPVIYAQHRGLDDFAKAAFLHARYHMKKYDLIFWVRPVVMVAPEDGERQIKTLKSDGVRDTQFDYCIEIDGLFRDAVGLLKDFGIDNIEETTINDHEKIKEKLTVM
jgi:nicotinamide riboside kinase